MQYKRIVLNEPHASIEGLYDNQLSFWNFDEHFINDIVLKWTDWHTDFLFHGYRSNNVRTVRFPYSRFIVDAERLWFEKPELAQRTKIWQSMMPNLTEETAIHLASCYDFSGGQIENITRKCDIESILYGDDYVTDEKIEQYCREEKIVKKGSARIGFV